VPDLSQLVTLSIVLALAALGIGAATRIVSALRLGGRREEPVDLSPAVAESRFTIPVSVIVPIDEGSAPPQQTIAALLGLNYPEFEVIVVTNEAPTTLIERLTTDWQLEAKEFFYRQTLKTEPVRRIYRSARDQRLMVVDKESSRYGDALNCGVNVARYRYVVAVPPGIAVDPNALLRIMSAALRDPATVVAASSHVDQGRASSVHTAFQQLESARALMDSRLQGQDKSSGLVPRSAVLIWRRDAVIALNGFSLSSADPALDMTLRMQTANTPQPGRFARGGNIFGRIEHGGSTSAFRLAAVRQRAALEVLFSWRRGNGRHVGFWPFIRTEFAAPIAELWVVLATCGGVAAGWFPWTTAAWLVVVLSFGHAAVNSAALLLRGSVPEGPEGSDLLRLLLMGPFEFVGYRPAIALARITAMVEFVANRTYETLRTSRTYL
jgi:hypothetical protein